MQFLLCYNRPSQADPAASATALDDQAVLQEEIKALEHQRQEIFDVEDEIEAKRDALIAALQRRLNQSSRCIPLIRVRWHLEN